MLGGAFWIDDEGVVPVVGMLDELDMPLLDELELPPSPGGGVSAVPDGFVFALPLTDGVAVVAERDELSIPVGGKLVSVSILGFCPHADSITMSTTSAIALTVLP